MATALEEEIRRRRAADALALLEAPEAQTQAESDSTKSTKPDTADQDIYGDWRKWPSIDPDQIPSGHIDLKPPETPLTIPTPTPESPSGPTNVLTDPESGTPFVLDPYTKEKIPRAEMATPAEKEAFAPSNVTLAERTVTRTPRATLVDPDPDAQYMTPDVLGFIKGSQNAILNPAAGVIPPTRRAELVKLPTYPTIAEDQGAPGAPPKVQRGELVKAPPVLPTGPKAPSTHTELAPPGQMDLRPDELQTVVSPEAKTPPVTGAQPAVKPAADDWKTWITVDGTTAEPSAAKPQEPLSTTQPNGTPYPTRTQAVGEKDPSAFIVHHTSGRGTVDGVISTLKERGLGVQYVMDREGNIFQTGGPGAQNIKAGWGKGEGLNNSNVVGMEIIANNDKDVTPAQKEAFARFIAARYPNTPLYGHGEVNPGHKEADEGKSAKEAALAYRSGAPGTDPAEVLNQLNASGLNTTHFGYTGDPNLDSYSAAGEGKYVKRMVSGYDVALNAAGAALVGNPKPGEEFQYAGRTWRYGDKVPELYKDARFDIFDPTNTALSGGKLGGETTVAAPKKQDWESWATLSPTEATTAQTQEAAKQTQEAAKQTAILDSMQKSATNMPDFYHKLETPIPGVSDRMRQAVLDDYKKQLTAYAIDYYKEPDPEKALQRILSTPNLLTSAGEIWTKAGANFQHAWLSLAQQADSPTQTKLIDFINSVHPEATPEARTALINQVMSKTGKTRVDFVNALYNHALGENPDSVKNISMYSLLDAIDVSAQPGMIAKEQENHAKVAAAVAQNRKDLREDPTMENTYGGVISGAIAQLPKNMAEALIPVIGQSAMFSEIYTDTLEGLRKDHPDWSEDQLKAKAAAASLPQDVLQEVVNLATMGLGGGVVKGISNPLARMAANSVLHGGIAATAGAAQQGVANVATGRPMTEGLPQAAVTGGIQGLIGGAMHVPEARVRTPEAITKAPLGEQPITPPVETGERGAPVHGAEERTMETGGEVKPPPPPTEIVPPKEEQTPPIDNEEALNKQAEDLYKRHQAELKIEAEIKPADIVTGEQESGTTPPGEPGTGGIQQPIPGDSGSGDQLRRDREGGERGGEPVSPELGRVPRTLDTKLSPQESAAFEPDRQALKTAEPGTPEFTQAFRNLREKVIQRFKPILDALNVRRLKDDHVSSSTGQTYAYAAGRGDDGVLELHTHLREGARDTENIMRQGADPVENIHSAVQEEILHFMHKQALEDEWNAKGGYKGTGETAVSYEVKQNASLIRDAVRARDAYRVKGDHMHATLIDHALVNSIRLYDSRRYSTEQEARARLDSMLADPTSHGDVNLHLTASELVRQLTQAGAREPLTESHFKNWWAKAGDFYKQALRGLVNLYRKLGPRSALAKLELARIARMVRAKIVAIDKIVADRELTPGDKSALGAGEAGPVMQRPRAPARRQSLGEAIKERLRSGVRWYGQTFKSGESAMLDHKETQPLALAIRRRSSLEQKFGQRAQVMQLADAFNKVSSRDRPRVVKEFTDYVRAEQNKQPLPRVSADTRAILDTGKNTLEQLGQISKELNVHVRTSDGKIRPMKLIGRDYYPRMISDDMHDIFNHRDDTRAQEFNAIVDRQIARGVVKSRDEFIDKFTRAVTLDATSNGHFGNIEKAREAQLPLEFYDFSPEALIKYANRSTDRLAQIAAYGQKLSSKGKDLFDHTIEQVQRASGYSHADKQTIINRIGEERKAEYQEREKSNLDQLSSGARTLASGAFLGNPITSMYNLISGAAQNLTFGGPGAFAKTAAKFLTIKGALDNIKEARERNILKSNLSQILNDYELVTDQNWATRAVQGFTHRMLKWGGQNLTEGVNRAFAMQQAKYILNRFARIYGEDNAPARSLYAMIQRRGIHDLNGLAREKGSGPLTDEFLRQYVMDVHGNYGPSQSAAHLFDSPAGKVLTQFQKWGANTQRMATREFLMPLARSVAERKPADFAYQLTRNLAYLATAAGAGVASQALRNLITGKDPQDPTIQEIWQRFGRGENARAMQMALQRAWGAVILSGFTGTIGNYSDLVNQFTGATPGGRVHDPLHPPAWGIVQPFIEFLQGWHGENQWQGAPSPRLWDQLGQNVLSGYRTGKQIGLNATSAAGLKWKPSEEYAAQNNLSFLRSRLKQFEDENPVFKQKRERKGTQSISVAGRSEFSPYRDRIQAALTTGHAEEARLAFADWLDRFPPGEQKGQIKSIKQSIQASSPIKPGGSYSLDTELQFLKWAKENLPAEEARQIFATAQTYAKTAMETGLFDRSKTMQQISKIDYDKFVVSTPKATTKVTVARPNQPSLADQIRKELAAKALLRATH